MKTLGVLSQRGWRRTGAVNVILASTCGLVLLICLIVSLKGKESSADLGTSRIYQGSCSQAATASTTLHVALNIVSTGVLASSNFFMQIVTSPSRGEVDRAHQYLRSLDIGLQSTRNLPALSRMKQICWVMLLMSSIPLHLFFNSAVYKTAYQSQRWNLAIATEQFVANGIENKTYWLPGASLAGSGTSSPAQQLWHDGEITSNQTIYRIQGFGDRNIFDQGYLIDQGSELPRNVSSVAEKSLEWVHLNVTACMAEFRPSKVHTQYRDLVMVVDSGTTSNQGWIRSQVFDFTPESKLSNTWNSRMPPNGVNSLWYWTQCTVDTPLASQYWTSTSSYYHSCGRLFGLHTSYPLYSSVYPDPNSVSFEDDGLEGITTAEEISQGYIARTGARTLQIKYCLAEPTTCQVRVSNTLLLIVILCVLIKVATCIFILSKLTEVALVTPGDAIESFITAPDPVTEGLGSLGFSDAQNLECKPRKAYSTTQDPALTFVHRPGRWLTKTQGLHSAVGRGIWVQVYYPSFLALVMVIVALIFSSMSGLGEFGPSENTETTTFGDLLYGSTSYLTILIVVNTPQVILSFIYLTINTLHTQLKIEQEWNSYGGGYTPLRVSYPSGMQVSTYRLQLPYKYSIPLIAISTLLHWLLSNSLFLLFIERPAQNESTAQLIPMEGLGDKDHLKELARGKLRWGAMPLPRELAAKIQVEANESVMHLSLGGEINDVQAPKSGVLYV
ncbi:hypothetical protein JX266_006173 [Neoarthrinium moseri]|nr:hypothetical protein JX266_006173 [Neoarthrinium moseri]